jgi:hypothetical protein
MAETTRQSPKKAVRTSPKPAKVAKSTQDTKKMSGVDIDAVHGKKIGRPSKYSDALAQVICLRISNGEALTQIVKDDAMPSHATIYTWLLERPTFLDIYARAREEQADTNADQIIAIADEMPPEYTDDKGRTTLDPTFINWQKQRIEARKWTAMKLRPKKYGDKVGIHGVDGEAAIKTEDTNAGALFDLIRNMEMTKRVG